MHDVVITGASTWTCFGRGRAALGEALGTSKPGFAPLVDMMFLGDPWFTTGNAMQVPHEPRVYSNYDDAYVEVDPIDWPVVMAVETALDAWLDAGAPPYERPRIGVVNGSSHGSNHSLVEFLRQKIVENRVPDPRLMAESASWVARQIGRRMNARGPNLTISTACSSGVNSIGQAMRMLQSGRIDCAIAGGNDTFSIVSFAGFNSLRAVDARGCRPFDLDRQGMSLGDGAAYCVLEREEDAERRGATILARITGYASAGEAHHPTAPDPSGRGALTVMTRAIETDPNPRELDFVSAHGTGTNANDETELRAIEELLRRLEVSHSVAVSSVKSQTGHTLGAAGAVQIVATIECARRGFVHGTPSLEHPLATSRRIELLRAPRRQAPKLALCNSFGFGGSVAAMALRPIEERP